MASTNVCALSAEAQSSAGKKERKNDEGGKKANGSADANVYVYTMELATVRRFPMRQSRPGQLFVVRCIYDLLVV